MRDRRQRRQVLADRPDGRLGGVARPRPSRPHATVAALVALGLIAALTSGCDRPATARPAPAPPAPPAAIRLAGHGSLTTTPFPVAGGLTVFSVTHPGEGSFWVHLLDGRGRPQRVLVGTSKPFTGSVGVGLAAGAYMLRTETAGSWTVVVTQPRAVAPASLPKTYRGKGKALVGPFHGRGTVRLTATYDEGEFAVDLLTDTGALLYTVVDATDQVKPSGTLAALEDGGYYLEVDADGSWAVTLTGTS